VWPGDLLIRNQSIVDSLAIQGVEEIAGSLIVDINQDLPGTLSFANLSRLQTIHWDLSINVRPETTINLPVLTRVKSITFMQDMQNLTLVFGCLTHRWLPI